MSPTRYPTLRKPIDLTLDMDGRTGRVRIDGVVDIDVKSVPHIVTGEPHRALLKLPNGFEFRMAEVARTGPVHTSSSHRRLPTDCRRLALERLT